MKPTGTGVRSHMHATEGMFHMIMMVCTFGLWYPIYKHRKNKLARTTRFYAP